MSSTATMTDIESTKPKDAANFVTKDLEKALKANKVFN